MNEIATLVRESITRAFPALIPRNKIIDKLAAPAQSNPIEVITGVRQGGKTFYLFQLMQELINDGFPAKRIFYFSFADLRLLPMAADVVDQVLDAYWRQVPRAREKGCYVFLDDIQEVEGWSETLGKVAENENVTLVVAGSMLGSLADAEEFEDDRFRVHELYPLSFREFCRFQGLTIPEQSESPSVQTLTRLEILFVRFLDEGGFPGIQRLSREEQVSRLQDLVQSIVLHDVASQLGRNDAQLAKLFALHGLRESARELSLNLLVERLREQGFKVYWEKANGILELLEQAFLVERLEEHSATLKAQSTSVPKVYAIDPGVSLAVSSTEDEDLEWRFETTIYLELRKRLVNAGAMDLVSYSVPRASNKKVDLVLLDSVAGKPAALIQACSSLKSELTKAREIESLDAAMKATGLREGTTVTLREEEVIEAKHGTIRVVPAWKWCLLSNEEPFDSVHTKKTLTLSDSEVREARLKERYRFDA